jgi:hypothetical protein
LTKGNKRKEPKIKVLAYELLDSTLLFNASSLVIHQSFKSLFTDFSHVKFDRPLPLFLLPVRLITLLRIGHPRTSVAYIQTISSDVERASPQLVPPLVSHVCHHSGPDIGYSIIL